MHFHTEFVHFPILPGLTAPAVTTMHGRLDLPGYPALFSEFSEAALVSVSDDQRKPLPARWIATVPHGLPSDLYTFSPDGAGGYLAFLGRISPEKRLDRAIEIAERAGATLKIAAKVDKVDAAYFEAVIRPLLRKPGIEYIGEISDREKQAFLSGAKALLFPIDWPEPFGIVQIEAMACGTPVIAWRRGSVPEVIDHGVTGFIVDRIEEAVAAVDKVSSLSRKAVRRGFERRFSIERVARDYIRVYESFRAEPILLPRSGPPQPRRLPSYERVGRRPASIGVTRAAGEI